MDVLDLQNEPLPLYNPDTSYNTPEFDALQKRVNHADALILGTPDYHGSISSTLKNFLDHFWHEFAGKLFATVVASHEKGLTATDQLRTVARQCYAWTLPYGISFAENTDLKDGQVASGASGGVQVWDAENTVALAGPLSLSIPLVACQRLVTC